MTYLHKLRRWLKGSLTCIKCGKEFQILSFGYGEAICPNCYESEGRFLFYDTSYWLNRLIQPQRYDQVEQDRIECKVDTLPFHEELTMRTSNE